MEKEKTYTTTDLMEITGLTRAAVLKRAKPFGFTKYCRYVLKRTSWGNYIKEFSFTESQVKAMGYDHDLRNIEKEVAHETTKEDLLKRLRKEHPLVTNDKCFVLSWFPDTVPSVLKDDEEQENCYESIGNYNDSNICCINYSNCDLLV